MFNGALFILLAVSIIAESSSFTFSSLSQSSSITSSSNLTSSSSISLFSSTEASFLQSSKTILSPSLISEMDLIHAIISSNNTSYNGFNLIAKGFHQTPIISLKSNDRAIHLNSELNKKLLKLLSISNEMTFMISIKQDIRNSGTILSIANENDRLMEIQSSGRRDEIRFHYQHSGNRYSIVFPYHLADSKWHRLSISISGHHIDLYIDCERIYRKTIYPVDWDSNATVWIGQSNRGKFLFKGYLRDAKFITRPNGYILQCPNLETNCPTCGQFKSLQISLMKLEDHIKHLTEKLLATEKRLLLVEECECHRSCNFNGSIKQDGDIWRSDCNVCECKRGQVICTPVICPSDPCKKNDSKLVQDCCPSCKKKCLFNGKLYQHGEKHIHECRVCTCENGRMGCVNKNSMCPLLNCSVDKQFKREGDCCKYCSDHNFCGDGHNCHDNATCINMRTGFTCSCDTGFTGDGKHCTDIDECSEEGGHVGHLCRYNTKCVNTLGSYSCQCLPGFIRKDSLNCIDANECQLNIHKCHPNAQCINTLGGYKCKCQSGYKGDGFNCEPICSKHCLNGGKCIGPDKCHCRRGFMGKYCENDINECELGLHQCHKNAECVNKIGWYHCECIPGYRSVSDLDEDNQLKCIDIDECNELTDQCSESSRCINADGGYACECNDTNCNNECIVDGKPIEGIFKKGCDECQCIDGIISCKKQNCDFPEYEINKKFPVKFDNMSDNELEINSKSNTCKNENNIRFNGERWTEGCEICECLFGEIDCWSTECAPLSCSTPVTRSGECCPICEDDPCDAITNTTSIGCMFSGISYQNGQAVPLTRDPCTTCKCKVPICEHSVSNSGFNLNYNRMVNSAVITMAHVLMVIMIKTIFPILR